MKTNRKLLLAETPGEISLRYAMHRYQTPMIHVNTCHKMSCNNNTRNESGGEGVETEGGGWEGEGVRKRNELCYGPALTSPGECQLHGLQHELIK